MYSKVKGYSSISSLTFLERAIVCEQEGDTTKARVCFACAMVHEAAAVGDYVYHDKAKQEREVAYAMFKESRIK